MDKRSKEYADLKLRYRRRNKYYYNSIESHLRLSIPEGANILELGCAAGDTINMLSPYLGIGVDFNPHLIEQAKKIYPEFQFHCIDLNDVSEFNNFFK